MASLRSTNCKFSPIVVFVLVTAMFGFSESSNHHGDPCSPKCIKCLVDVYWSTSLCAEKACNIFPVFMPKQADFVKFDPAACVNCFVNATNAAMTCFKKPCHFFAESESDAASDHKPQFHDVFRIRQVEKVKIYT